MNLLKQLGIILLFTLFAEMAHLLLPFPIPSSIYGLIFLLFCLYTHIVRLDQIKETGVFLLEIMPVMFIPAAVGLIAVWSKIQTVLIPIIIITLLSTVIVMVATGKTAQLLIQQKQEKTHE